MIVLENEQAGMNADDRSPQRIGWFRYWFAEQRWLWSDDVAALHGYTAGQVDPTTELVLTHTHPDDRAEVTETLARTTESGAPFSSRHRVVDAAGATRDVLVVGDRLHDDSGALIGTTGYYLDVTADGAPHAAVADTQMPELVTARAVIEQAKGALMLAYGIDAEQAFRVLVWRSQETSMPVRRLARTLITALTEFGGTSTQVRPRFDHLLLTVHERR